MNPRRWVIVCGSLFDHGREENLRKYRTQFPHSSTKAVSSAAYTSRKYFGGRNKSCGIRAEVEEKLCENIKDKQVLLREDFPCKPENTKNDRQNTETYDLDRFSSQSINGKDSQPVSR